MPRLLTPKCMQLQAISTVRPQNWLEIDKIDKTEFCFGDRKEKPFKPCATNAANAFRQFTNTENSWNPNGEHWKHVCKAVKCNCRGSANWAPSRGQLFCNVHISMPTWERRAGRGVAFKRQEGATQTTCQQVRSSISPEIASIRFASHRMASGCVWGGVKALGAGWPHPRTRTRLPPANWSTFTLGQVPSNYWNLRIDC